jgi:hypothetical protein
MRTRILVVAAAFAVGFVACGGDDGPQSPVNPSPATLRSLSIAGPAELAPGTTAQYTATGLYSDGTARDLTTSASWNSFTAPLRHVGGGRFQAFEAGDGRVNANVPGRSASFPVIVVTPGTFKLSGTIRDASGTVENVVIEVTSGTGAGLSTKSTFNGRYALFGIAGVVGLRASAPGYTTQELQVTVEGHGVRDVDISPVSEPVEVSGNWTLVVTASSACSDTWPAQARKREVAATVAQQGTKLSIRFPNAVFSLFGANNNPARIAGSAFSMTLFYDDYYLDYTLMERISPNEWVGVNGDLTGTATSTSITGEFVGNFHYYQSATNFPTGFPSSCVADRQFEFRR